MKFYVMNSVFHFYSWFWCVITKRKCFMHHLDFPLNIYFVFILNFIFISEPFYTQCAGGEGMANESHHMFSVRNWKKNYSPWRYQDVSTTTSSLSLPGHSVNVNTLSLNQRKTKELNCTQQLRDTYVRCMGFWMKRI